MSASPTVPAGRLGACALALVVLFCVAAATVHVQRPEHDGWHAPLSFYLSGPGSAWLRGAYYGLAAGVVLLAAGLWRTLAPAARRQLVGAALGLGETG